MSCSIFRQRPLPIFGLNMASLSPSGSRLMAEEEEAKICALCSRQFAKYSCPRCNILYCSLTCYKDKNHSQCSESFYRDNIVTELQQRDASDADRAKMLEMLQRLEEEDMPSPDSAEASLEERLSGLDLDRDSEEIWERLTPSEREEFLSMAQGGALSRLLPAAQPPWWETADRLVTPLDTPGDKDSATPLPPLVSNVPPLESLVKSGPVSPCVCNDVINVLYAYAYVVRMYDMSHHELPIFASQTLLDISSCLSCGANFETVESALHSAMTAVSQNESIFNSESFLAAVLNDVKCILCSPKSSSCLVSRALCDVHKLLGLARCGLKEANTDVRDAKTAKESRKKLLLVRKKVQFYLAWANVQENVSRCKELSVVINMEYEGELAKLHSKRTNKLSESQRDQTGCDKTSKTSHKESGTKNLKLIQELD